MLHKPSTDFVGQSRAIDADSFVGVTRRPTGRKWPVNYNSVAHFALAADIATIVVSSLFSGFLYHWLVSGTENYLGKSFGSAILVGALFTSLAKVRGVYNPAELLALRKQIRSVFTTWITVILLFAGAVFTMKVGSDISRGTSILFSGIGLAALILNRQLAKSLLAQGLAHRRFSGPKIVLIADDESKNDSSVTEALIGSGSRVKMSFLLPAAGGMEMAGQKFATGIIDYVRDSDVEEILIVATPERWSDLRTLLAELRVLPFPVKFVPIGPNSEIFKRPRREFGDAICVELQRGLLTSFERAAKRSVDIVAAATALLSLLPLLLIVAAAIKFDSPGPVLFRQRRCGFNGKHFLIRKFRTMTVLEDGQSVVQAKEGDNRFTRLGVWLRRTSIDELPQLLNVLDGSMSLVGPRPHATAHDNEFDTVVEKYAFRRRVKPGLTGWAQVHGFRGPTPTAASIEQRVEFDLWYIDNWSLSLDLAILLWTPVELIRGRNAY